MGLFGKLKNILFEDDDEVEEMPVYTKEEVAEDTQEIKIEPTVTTEQTVEPVAVEPTRFTNVKRDIDIDFADDDVIGEVPGAFEDKPQIPAVTEEPKPVVPEVKEEKKSVFLDFDEDEFERLNARINHNESKATQREVVRRVDVPVTENYVARQANNNFSSTEVSEEQKDPERYKINSGTIVSGKKPFTPSPVISPVYGILGKNFTKDDIVDRKGGLKRERTNVKLLPKKEEVEEDVEDVVVSVETVRKKAYGEDIELPKIDDKKEVSPKEEVKEVKRETKPSEEVYSEVEDVVEEKPVVRDRVEETTSIEDQIEDENFEVETNDEELNTVIDEVVPEAKAEKVEKKKMKVLDDLEKTSTLKILDDIEKELNSIKPISKEEDEEEEVIAKEHEKTMDDTLENDLFNLIDSMYEEGDEDDD
jgi:hypothetical protein